MQPPDDTDIAIENEDGEMETVTRKEMREHLNATGEYHFAVFTFGNEGYIFWAPEGEIYQNTEDVPGLWRVENEEIAHVNEVTPSEDFWEWLCDINEVTSQLANHYIEAQQYGVKNLLPDQTQYAYPNPPEFPPYERDFIQVLYFSLFREKTEGGDVWRERPRLRRLIKHAYEVTGEEISFSLSGADSWDEYIEEKKEPLNDE